MRPRRHTGSGTDAPAPPDDGTPPDDRTDFDSGGYGVEVRVERGQGGARVGDLDGEPVARAHSSGRNTSSPRRMDRSPDGHGQVDAPMDRPAAGDGVDARPERRRDRTPDGEADRTPQTPSTGRSPAFHCARWHPTGLSRWWQEFDLRGSGWGAVFALS
nr:hypothetical protein [Rubricoccus marinus]